MHRTRTRRLSRERGTISVLAGISLVLVVAAAALSVDVGKAAWTKRRLQSVVDAAALDAVRALGDRRDPATFPEAQARKFARESAQRNSFDPDGAENSLVADLGLGDPATHLFTPLDPGNYGIANAVRVTATTISHNSFMPGTMSLNASGLAVLDVKAKFWIGSRAAGFDTARSATLNAIMGSMLGGASLDAASYNGLAGAGLPLGFLWTQLSLGNPGQIANGNVGIRDLFNAAATVLTNQGDGASLAAVTPLTTLATQVNPALQVSFGQMLGISTPGVGDVADARINVLDLIGAAAQVANGTNLVTATVPITVPGVTTTRATISLIEKPAIASGPARKDGTGKWITRAHTAQARVQLNMTLTDQLVIGLTHLTVSLPIYVEGARADGELTAASCVKPESNRTITVHATTSGVSAAIGTATDSSMTNPNQPATILPGGIASAAGLVNITGGGTASVPGTDTSVTIPLGEIRTVGTTSTTLGSGLKSALTLTVQILGGIGLNATTIANQVRTLLNPVLDVVDTSLLKPLTEALGVVGVQLAGADIKALGADCGSRHLIG